MKHKLNQKGILNPNFKDGHTINPICKDCGCKIYPNGVRCSKCYHKIRKILQLGNKNPNYKTGLGFCKICGKINKSYGRLYCSKKCFGISELGIKHHNYLGLTDLRIRLRNSNEHKSWRKEIFERDNYTCQKCSKRGGILDPHHIIRYSIIVKEFLKKYNKFDSIKDKEILIVLAKKYKPFWDINNGRTLCRLCHNKTKGDNNSLKFQGD